jgi:hypothetical protein
MMKQARSLRRALALSTAAASMIPAAAPARPPQPSYAVVNADGTLARGLNATGVVQLGTGIFEVDFNRDVSGCAYHGNVGLAQSGGTPPVGYLTVAPRLGNPKGVYIEVLDPTGENFLNAGFHLHVAC